MTDISLSINTSGDVLANSLKQAQSVFHEWRVRARGRRELARMSALELTDIGLSHADRSFEAAKPFWKG